MKGLLASPITLIVGVPFLFLAFVALAGVVPALFVNPAHDFVYTQSSFGYYRAEARDNFYINESGNLVARIDPATLSDSASDPRLDDNLVREAIRTTRLYRFNVASWTATPLTYVEAQKFTYSDYPTSPDGYTFELSRGARGGVFPFFVGSYSGSKSILKKGVLSKVLPINIINDYQTNAHFIGWILK